MGLSGTEIGALDNGFDFIIGIDEAGRGPICGPVSCAAFCWLNPGTIWEYSWSEDIGDSKTIKEALRDEIYEEIVQDSEENVPGDYLWTVVDGTVEEIDNSNILAVTLDCMGRACQQIVARLKQYRLIDDRSEILVLIDGNKIPPALEKARGIHALSVVKGDSTIFTISCASIMAKCHRDAVMRNLHCRYPEYSVDIHKGYLTQLHREAILDYGPSSMHRLTFEPCKGLLIRGQFAVPEGRSIECVKRKAAILEAKKKGNRNKSKDIKTYFQSGVA